MDIKTVQQFLNKLMKKLLLLLGTTVALWLGISKKYKVEFGNDNRFLNNIYGVKNMTLGITRYLRKKRKKPKNHLKNLKNDWLFVCLFYIFFLA